MLVITGVVRERSLSRLPRTRCWWVGKMKPGLAMEDALAFNRRWNTELNLGINDCRHHTLGEWLFNLLKLFRANLSDSIIDYYKLGHQFMHHSGSSYYLFSSNFAACQVLPDRAAAAWPVPGHVSEPYWGIQGIGVRIRHSVAILRNIIWYYVSEWLSSDMRHEWVLWYNFNLDCHVCHGFPSHSHTYFHNYSVNTWAKVSCF